MTSSILITLLIVLLCIVLINQFVSVQTPVGIILVIVVILVAFGYHGRGTLF